MPTITYTEELVTEVCWCGINHAIPRNLARQAREKGTAVYCPLGHTWVIRETEVDKLRKQLESERQSKKFWQDQADAAEKSKTALKGQLTKARKRAANGVCPCCNRSFVDVARHMRSKHPEVGAAPAAVVDG